MTFRPTSASYFLVGLLVFGVLSASGCAAAFFELGSVSPKSVWTTVALDISDDGTTVIGDRLWTYTNGTWLDLTPAELVSASKASVSGDGSVIVGRMGEQGTTSAHAYRWTAENGAVDLGVLPSSFPSSSAEAVSDDGRIVVGGSSNSGFFWTSEKGMVSLGFGVSPRDVSNNGFVVGNFSFGDNSGKGFIWSEQSGFTSFPWVPVAITDDGNTVVGSIKTPDGLSEACYWTQEGGLVNLGHFKAQWGGAAWDVSDDGSRIVGVSDLPLLNQKRATIWSPESGLQDLASVLEASGVDLQGWELNIALGISGDGRFVVGRGTYKGLDEAFWAELPETIPQVADPSGSLPEPRTVGLLLSSIGTLAMRRWRRRYS